MTVGNSPLLALPTALSAVALASFLALTSPDLADPVHIVGTAGITDGDTLRIGTDKIRLFGIDAPERHQSCVSSDGQAYACGQMATRALADFIAGREVDCEVSGKDRYQRSIAVCLVDGVDVGAWLVSSGLAVAYRKYSTDYVGQESTAREAKIGLWSGYFVNPSDWRKRN